MKRFKNILYVVESKADLGAFQSVIDLAIENNAQLTVVQVVEPIPPYLNRLTPHLLRQALIDETMETLDKLRELGAGRLEIGTKIIEGSPFLEIIREV